MPSLRSCLVPLSIVAACVIWQNPFTFAEPDQPVGEPAFHGKALSYWVSEATGKDGPADLEKTVAALSAAVLDDDPETKVAAADALAVLGPKAIRALPALMPQFGHKFGFVRASCQAAVGAMGEESVPALIDTFENKTGGPRIRAAFVLGSMGPKAKAAVPALAKAMAKDTPVMQDRLAGVLSQIDPERFGRKSTHHGGYQPGESRPLAVPTTTDWPQFHGPARDSVCREHGLLQQWPEGGPKLLWTLQGLGRGYSTVSIADGKILTMGDRVEGSGSESQYVIAFDLKTRNELWATRVGPPFEDGGPRSTPTIDGSSAYVVGTEGDLVCLDTETGKIRWKRSFVDDFAGKYMAIWKFSESPLVDGQRLICTPGGPEATMVALDKSNGKVIWKCAMPDIGEKGADGAGYSSVVVAEMCGIRQYIQVLGRGVIGVEAATGRFLWGYNRIANTVANVTAPIVRGDYVFASTAYHTGSVLLKIKSRFTPPEAEGPAWPHPVIHKGKLYLRHANSLFCYDLRDGSKE